MKNKYLLIVFLIAVTEIIIFDLQSDNSYIDIDKGKLTFTTISDGEMQEQEVTTDTLYLMNFIQMLTLGITLIIEHKSVSEIIDIEHIVFKNDKQYPRGCITTLA